MGLSSLPFFRHGSSLRELVSASQECGRGPVLTSAVPPGVSQVIQGSMSGSAICPQLNLKQISQASCALGFSSVKQDQSSTTSRQPRFGEILCGDISQVLGVCPLSRRSIIIVSIC